MNLPAELQEIVNEYRSKGCHLSDEEVEYIHWYCHRKMEVAKIENREEYLPLLFGDEVKNHLLRNAINATTILRMLEKEGELCVQSVEAIPV